VQLEEREVLKVILFDYYCNEQNLGSFFVQAYDLFLYLHECKESSKYLYNIFSDYIIQNLQLYFYIRF